MTEKVKLIHNRALIYCRVSTTEQAIEGNSLITQEKACREYAEKHGYKVGPQDIYLERGESAKTANRTELQKLLAECVIKKNGVAVVIVYKLDRLARNIDDHSSIRLMLKKHGIEIKSVSEHIENNPAGRLMETMIAGFAQFDNDVRAERCSNGMREAVREGRYVWQGPVGYKNLQVDGKATIAPDDMAPLVLRAFEEVAYNLRSTEEVWRMMTREGLKKKNGQPLSRNYFYELLENRLYTGLVEKFGEQHRGRFAAIVSDELFARVQRVLANKGHKVSEYKTDNPAFPLRRFVFAPSSGLKITGSFSKGKYPYYRFGAKGANYARDDFEERFGAHMDSYAFAVADIAKLKRKVRERFNVATADDRRESDRLQKLIQTLEDEQTALVQKNIKGVLSDAVLAAQLARVERETLDAQAALALLRSNEASPEEAVEFTEEYLCAPSKTWKNAGISTQIKNPAASGRGMP